MTGWETFVMTTWMVTTSRMTWSVHSEYNKDHLAFRLNFLACLNLWSSFGGERLEQQPNTVEATFAHVPSLRFCCTLLIH